MKDNTTKNGKDQSQAFAKTDPAPTGDTRQTANKTPAPQSVPKVYSPEKNVHEESSKA
ncbi:MAG: hypothetical protein JWN14_5052 [Chthonomonadales bacterium]|nr:hypothetical protein [Chthonomonadales bacterium]